MRFLFRLVLLVVSAALAAGIELLFLNGPGLVFPTPRLTLIFFVLLVALSTNLGLVWLSIVAGYVLEVFSPLPHGVLTMALALGTIAAYSVMRFIFAERTITGIFASTASAATVYELVMVVSTIIFKSVGSLGFWRTFATYALPALVRICLTVVLSTLLYMLIIRLARSINPRYLSST